MGEHVNQYQEISNWVVNFRFVIVLMCWLWLFGCDLLICICCHVIYALKTAKMLLNFSNVTYSIIGRLVRLEPRTKLN